MRQTHLILMSAFLAMLTSLKVSPDTLAQNCSASPNIFLCWSCDLVEEKESLIKNDSDNHNDKDNGNGSRNENEKEMEKGNENRSKNENEQWAWEWKRPTLITKTTNENKNKDHGKKKKVEKYIITKNNRNIIRAWFEAY